MSWEQRVVENSRTVTNSKRRSLERSRQIVDAVRAHRFELGEQPTVQQLAEIANVSLQTFYRYFPSKDELLLAVLQDEVDAGIDRIRELIVREPTYVDRLRVLVEHPITVVISVDRQHARRIAAEHHRLLAVFPREVEGVIRSYAALIKATIDEAVDAGEIPAPDIDTGVLALNICMLVLNHFHHVSSGAFEGDPRADVSALWAFCAHVLGVPQEHVAPE